MQALEIDIRPWGRYEVLLDSSFTKVKLITVEPNRRLSYQSHKKREENWTVVEGELTVELDSKIVTLSVGHSIHIPLGAKHRAINKTSKAVQFIEVQTGTYFGEDDITRFEDDYDRVELEWKEDHDGHMLDNEDIWN